MKSVIDWYIHPTPVISTIIYTEHLPLKFSLNNLRFFPNMQHLYNLLETVGKKFTQLFCLHLHYELRIK